MILPFSFGQRTEKPVEAPDPALKGKRGGNCNRTACQKPGATWKNSANNEYYCPSCARLINRTGELCHPDPELRAEQEKKRLEARHLSKGEPQSGQQRTTI